MDEGAIIDLIRMKYWQTKEGYKHLNQVSKVLNNQKPSNVVIAGQMNNVYQGDITTIDIESVLVEIYEKIDADGTLLESQKQVLKQRIASLTPIIDEIKKIGYPAAGHLVAQLISKIFGIV